MRTPLPFSRALWGLLPILLLLAGPGPGARGADGEFDLRHPRLARVLQGVVRDGRVDYARLRGAPGELDAYLDAVAAVPAATFQGWAREDRLALLLNLYNAATLRLIADHHPLGSIRDIGLLPGAAWRREGVRFGGRRISLDHLEHRMIRPDYGEPRIHFALVCAARGCPPLRTEPYVGDRLEAQLADQARVFLAQTAKNRFDPDSGTLWLSPIFDWYRDDFLAAAPSLEAYVRPLLPADAATALGAATGPVRVRFSDYDWRLNGTDPDGVGSP
jgi:hypothetical protein